MNLLGQPLLFVSYTSRHNCIKQFWRLPDLNRHILANQVLRYNWNNCFNCNVKPDWPELAGQKLVIQSISLYNLVLEVKSKTSKLPSCAGLTKLEKWLRSRSGTVLQDICSILLAIKEIMFVPSRLVSSWLLYHGLEFRDGDYKTLQVWDQFHAQAQDR